MKVEAIPLTDFVHGSIHAREGKVIVPYIDEDLAREFERHGLVRIKMAPQPILKNDHVSRTEHYNAMTKNGAIDAAGKAPDDGEGRPSSVLPAAQASPQKMSPSSKAGKDKALKTGT